MKIGAWKELAPAWRMCRLTYRSAPASDLAIDAPKGIGESREGSCVCLQRVAASRQRGSVAMLAAGRHVCRNFPTPRPL